MSRTNFKVGVITQRLNQLYKESNLNQVDFAAKTGLTQASVSRYLSGSRPNLEAIFKIAVGCGVSVDWLLGLKEKR